MTRRTLTTVSEVEIRLTRFLAPVAQSLVGDALAELGQRYGGPGDETPVVPSEFDPPNGGFMVAWLDGDPVGCAGWRSHGDSDEVAELKRMYVASGVRVRGVGAALLAAVEGAARENGRKRMILECGARQPEAIALYQKRGYERIKDFGFYRDAPGVLSFGRDL